MTKPIPTGTLVAGLAVLWLALVLVTAHPPDGVWPSWDVSGLAAGVQVAAERLLHCDLSGALEALRAVA